MNLKEASEINKPYFDYANNILRTAAWYLAIGYVVDWAGTPHPNIDVYNKSLTWLGIVSAFLFGTFLLWSTVKCTMEICRYHLIESWTKGYLQKIKAVSIVMVVGFGLPAFAIDFSASVIEKFQAERDNKPKN